MAIIETRKDSDGRTKYRARVRMRGAPDASATFYKVSDAKKWIAETEQQVREGRYFTVSESRIHTLAEAIDRFIQEKSPNRNRITQLNRWREALGELRLGSITHIHINDVIAKWRAARKLQGQDFGAVTANNHLSAISRVFHVAVREWAWLPRNPCRDAIRAPAPAGRVRFLSDDERVALLQAAKGSDYKPLYLIVVLALSTGMRKEELLSLKWQDVDLNVGAVVLHKTKNKTRRRVAVRGVALELLKAHAKIRRIDSQFVFPGEKPGRKTEHTDRHFDIKKPWAKAVKEAALADFCFHDLRHSCASYLAMSGASPLEIAEVLGHKSLDMVKRYSHLAESHTASVVERMNSKFLGA